MFVDRCTISVVMDTIVDQCCFELIIVLSLTPAFDVFTFSVIADAQNIALIDT